MCVGRYGVQDTMGNAAEWTADSIQCTNETSCSLTSFDHKNMGNSEEMSTSVTSKFTSLFDYSFFKAVNYSTYWNTNAYQFTNVYNGFSVQQAPFISLTTGLPVGCGGFPYDACKSGGNFTDDIRFSLLTLHPLNNEPSAFNYPLSVPDYANSRVYVPYKVNETQYVSAGLALDTSALSPLTFVVGNFPCADYKNSVKCPSSVTGNGRYSYSTVLEESSTQMVGGRCASFIETDAQGDLPW